MIYSRIKLKCAITQKYFQKGDRIKKIVLVALVALCGVSFGDQLEECIAKEKSVKDCIGDCQEYYYHQGAPAQYPKPAPKSPKPVEEHKRVY